MELAVFVREAEAFLTAVSRERQLQQSGLKATLDLEQIYERHRALCTVDTFGQVRDLALDPQYRRALLGFVAEAIVGYGVRDLDARLAYGKAAGRVEWLATSMPLPSAPVALANEPDMDNRRALDDLVRAEWARLNPARAERIRRTGGLIDQLGYGDLLSLAADLGGLSGDVLAVAEGMLTSTAEPYAQALRDQLVHRQIGPADAREVDVGWICRGTEYDGLLPMAQLLPLMRATLAQLGLRLEDQPNLRWDLQARPLKISTSFTTPISVPDDIVVTAAPFGGRLDYDNVLEQVGVAQSYAGVDRTQPFVYRRLGDRAVNLGYGRLFGGLLLDEAWLRWRFEIGDTRDLVRLGAFQQLYRVRRDAALLRYGLEVYRAEEPESLGERYVDLLGEALGVRVFQEGYLMDVDAPASADKLRAWMFGAQVRAFLRREYDAEWFRSERAGGFLIDRWREGQRYTVEELVRFMGFDGLDPTPALDELQGILAA